MASRDGDAYHDLRARANMSGTGIVPRGLSGPERKIWSYAGEWHGALQIQGFD